MFDKETLKDPALGHTTYIMIGAAAIIVGLLLASPGFIIDTEIFAKIAGLFRYPGRALVFAGFLTAGLCGETIPTSVRIGLVAMATVLFLRLFAPAGFLFL